jgi:molecular chaperone DnaK
MKTPIGIDLGTTFSVVAHAGQDGSIQVVPNDRGELLTPSVVYFEGPGKVVVGAEAKSSGPVHPERVVTAIKRHMGKDSSLMFDGAAYRAEGISAVILRYLAASAAAALGVDATDLAAVVTVPAYFGTAEREATAAAANVASLSVLDLVAEPVAAALSYGVASEERGTLLVFDLGGGTFDATVIELDRHQPRVVAVDGASRLGGLNFDERIGTLLLERYIAATSDHDAAYDDAFIARVFAAAEDIKKRLSRTEAAAVPIAREGFTARVSVTRAEFEAASATLVHEALVVVDRVIESSRLLGASKPVQVLLTGGATRMPLIASSLTAHLQIPVRLNDPDLAVAKGAAIHARALLDRPARQVSPRTHGSATASRVLASAPVRSVTPRAIGIKLHDSNDPDGLRMFVHHLIHANTPLPVTGVMATFATVVDGQERVRIELMEQAGAVAAPDLEFNRRILDGELTGLPQGLKAGSPIDLCLSVRLDGRIECVATERSTQRPLTIESYVDGAADGAETEEQRRIVAGLLVKG